MPAENENFSEGDDDAGGFAPTSVDPHALRLVEDAFRGSLTGAERRKAEELLAASQNRHYRVIARLREDRLRDKARQSRRRVRA